MQPTLIVRLIAGLLLLATAAPAAAQITNASLTSSSLSQNFDGMTNEQTAALPTGWGFFNGNQTLADATTATTVTTQFAGTSGAGVFTSGSSGGAYELVNGDRATGTDKAIGFLNSGSFTSPRSIIFGFTNNTGSAVSSLSLTWDYEKYRSGTRAWDWTFFSSSTGTAGSYAAVAAGNQSYAGDANNTTVSNPPATTAANGGTPVTISGLNIANGSSYYLLWVLTGNGGSTNGQALGVDNFSLTATAAAAARVWTGTGTGGGTWANGQQGKFDAGGGVYVNSLTTPVEFQGVGESVAVSGAVQSGDVTFGVTGYTLTGGGGDSLTLGTGNVFVTNSGHTATINAVVAGSSGLSKAGAGTLILGGANTFTGAVNVNAGTLSVSADGQLGNAANNIVLGGGTLATTASFSTARGLSGTGSLDIAAGTTLTASGTVNAAGLTLANTGTLALTGTTPTIGSGGLTFTQAATVNASAGGLTLGGNITANNTTGTATVTGAIGLGSSARTFNVAAGGTLSVGNLSYNSAGTLRVNATGGGTLQLNGNLTNAGAGTSGFAIGTTGAAGPTVQIGSNTALGNAQTFLNSGTLQATANLTGANALAIGVSIGSRSTSAATIAGQNVTFSGTSSDNNFFLGGATATQVNVNNTTTLGGTIAQSGTTGAGGISIGGTGNLVIAGSATGVTEATTLVSGSGVRFTLDASAGGSNGTWGSAVTVSSGTTIAGNGAVAGNLTVAGTVDPSGSAGSLIGTLTNTGTGLTTAFSGGGMFGFDMVNGNNTAVAGTDYDTLAAQALNLTGVTSGNRFTIALRSLSSPTTPGSISAANFDVTSAHTYTLISSVNGVTGFTGSNQFTIDTSSFSVAGTGTLDSSFFTVGLSGNSLVLQFTPVPEPGTVLGVAAAGLGLARLVRRRRAVA